MQGNVDNDLGFQGRFCYRWSPAFTTRTNVQLAGPGQAMCSIENDYRGADFSAILKAINPSILDGGLTGMYMGSYLQSVTPRLSLGLDTLYQRTASNQPPDFLLSYAGKYRGDDWIASAQLLGTGGLTTTYWRRLAEKVEAGVECTLQFAGLGLAKQAAMMGGMPKNEGVTTIGVKYDFRQSSYRAQVDSQGKVACLLEKQVAPMVRVSFNGELDHAKV